MPNLYTQADSNIRKTWLLITVFLVLIIVLGWVFARAYQRPDILYFAVGLSFLMNFLAYYKSDSIALAMSHAQPVKREQYVDLFQIVENLCITAGLPMPRMYIIPELQINAFATGRNAKHAAVAVTQGALQKLNENELKGVLAHELSHVGNRDILISSVVVVLAGLVAILSDWFLRASFFQGRGDRDRDGGGGLIMLIGLALAILAPLAATLIRLAVSRKREYLADASGALLTRYPEGLASALEKIKSDGSAMRFAAHNATAHLFLSNPFKGQHGRSWLTNLFMTHPPLEDRIKTLRSLR
ncbi:MAG: zinc metalloprotease HtpX [Candidatus Yanofskybacteria bacterium RIFCSPHIGHO2_01_FULL_45_42]|uniref:Protease HtpX homolog n=3 Tax=Candidatus Yanofskyibacteriota TaxID=1752733 RepID=A0A1F8F3M0_9BACT|nr:MAG: zinc metalloprotease HtpX [Candidatus Yanofskybacteria bacterium RIFCSPHIGHO2_01_FULL_45_42]OGN16433.1 MAG: zinc metalloprotease HtpX [Candidatus Yanofskybacteria bacterium RIFCSPHIGHO2_02_FULL_46_19]OGN27378.1 MAG: zinc metalloprotease HtpX [Candidatus Yanofskybacteria bacterium RIFCSPLOWO2_01_FULL_45_72]OGN31699.1 MAG: zinc metalloprotease HtpX [Candidatus Yanofskybacteria bacterium RIFCSPLOWO2_02_FULL_45_18]